MKIYTQTESGQVFKCDKCRKIHVEFRNLNFNFVPKEFAEFARFILSLDGQKWEQVNSRCEYRRKIIIPIGTTGFNVVLNNQELLELKALLRKHNFRLQTFTRLTIDDPLYEIGLN